MADDVLQKGASKRHREHCSLDRRAVRRPNRLEFDGNDPAFISRTTRRSTSGNPATNWPSCSTASAMNLAWGTNCSTQSAMNSARPVGKAPDKALPQIVPFLGGTPQSGNRLKTNNVRLAHGIPSFEAMFGQPTNMPYPCGCAEKFAVCTSKSDTNSKCEFLKPQIPHDCYQFSQNHAGGPPNHMLPPRKMGGHEPQRAAAGGGAPHGWPVRANVPAALARTRRLPRG